MGLPAKLMLLVLPATLATQVLQYDANPLADSLQSQYNPNSPPSQYNSNSPQSQYNVNTSPQSQYIPNNPSLYAEQLAYDAEEDSAEERKGAGGKTKVKVHDRRPNNADQPFGFYPGPYQPGAEYQPPGHLQQPLGYQPGGPFQPPPGYQPGPYPSAGYQQAGYQPQAGYQQAGFPRPAGYQPAGFPPAGYQQALFQPAGYPHSGFQPTGYQPSGYQPAGYQDQPNGFKPAGSQQPANFQGFKSAGFNPAGFQSEGYQPADYQRTGYQPPSYEQVMLGYPPAVGAPLFAGNLPLHANGQPFDKQLEQVEAQLHGNRSV